MVIYHLPALLTESIAGLNLRPDGIYVDVTFGGGGHSRAILDQLTSGRLIAFDQDADAEANSISDARFTLLNQNFRYLKNNLRYLGITEIDGLIADLGVSFHQFDEQERGFSFRSDAELDMRMNRQSTPQGIGHPPHLRGREAGRCFLQVRRTDQLTEAGIGHSQSTRKQTDKYRQ